MIGDLFEGDGVERPAPGAAPSAFRIWRAGVNETDIGPCNLTPRALATLLAAQAARGNRYSFDLAHGTIKPGSPRDLQVAYGDHRIEGRGGELWAVDCQWNDWARAQIEQKPVPGLRYYSPAYDVDKDTREPTRYVNCALTPNPATWNATALAAAAKGTAMDPEKDKPPGDGAEGGSGPSVDVSTLVAGLHKLMTEAKDDADREMYRKALAVLMAPKQDAGGEQAAAEGDGEDPPSSSKDGGAVAKTAKMKASAPPVRVGSAAMSPDVEKMFSTLAKSVEGIKTRLDTKDAAEQQQRTAADATERTQLAAVKGLAAPIVTAIKDPTTPIATARSLASASGTVTSSLASLSTSSVQGTQGSPERAIAQLPAEQASVLEQQMGVRPAVAPRPHIDGMGQLVVPCETPSQVRARLAQKAAVTK